MKLNGWQRLWVVAAVIWGLVVAYIGIDSFMSSGFGTLGEAILFSFIYWLAPAGCLYLLGQTVGWVVPWVVRGFKNQ